MKTLHRYLTRQVLATLVMTVLVFTFVLLLTSVLREVLGLLVNRQASLVSLGRAIGLLVPYVLVFALPMGMLTATLLVFGRFSADQELTAARASGVSLLALVTPVLLLGVAATGVSALINMQWAPQCRTTYKALLDEIKTTRIGSFIPERTYITDFKGSMVYVSRVDGTNLENLLIYAYNRSNEVVNYIRAQRATYSMDPATQLLEVHLINGDSVRMEDGVPHPSAAGGTILTFTNSPTASRSGKSSQLSDMTHWQLWDQLRMLQGRMEEGEAVEPAPRTDLERRMRALRAQKNADLASPVRMHIHRQLSFSFACLSFTLIGIPLGIRAHRRETTFGIAMALILVGVYYAFFMLGLSLETRHEWAPHLILWVPNLLFQAIGAVLLWRANRGV
ncbi:MAG: hypothetical protein RJA22_134 [Verrucomicrobiota bacterium]|jgi:lipopolysaccharide export system permease protein